MNPKEKLEKAHALKREVFHYFDESGSWEYWKDINDNSQYYWITNHDQILYWSEEPDIEDIFQDNKDVVKNERDFKEFLEEEAEYSNYLYKSWEKGECLLVYLNLQMGDGREYFLFDKNKKIDLQKLFQNS